MAKCLRWCVLGLVALMPMIFSGAEPPVRSANPLVDAAAGNNAFAINVFQKLAAKPGNQFYSPINLRGALAMVQGGAAGATKDQMEKVLHSGGLPLADLAALDQAIVTGRPGYECTTANALFMQEGYPLNPAYTQLLQNAFRSQVRQLNFMQQTEASRQAINAWAAGATKNRIQNLMPQGSIKDDTRLVLTAAIYFKAKWREAFKKSNTKDEPFFLAGGGKTSTPLMFQSEEYKGMENDQFALVRMPYKDCPVEMVLIVPKATDGLPAVEKGLTAERLAGLVRETATCDVMLHLPRFKLTTDYQMNEVLSGLGMPLAFSDDADFTAMTSAERLKIGVVIHKAFVEVNEEGTEAAAATGVTMMPTAAPARERKLLQVRADRPFLFLLREPESGAILFMGRCADPSAN